ncbi:MAG: tetratricopeptide repeat protein [Candidatus Rickettsia vulgarisii]
MKKNSSIEYFNPYNTNKYYDLIENGNKLYDAGNYLSAIAQYNRAIKIDPDTNTHAASLQGNSA